MTAAKDTSDTSVDLAKSVMALPPLPATAQEKSRRGGQWEISLDGRYTGPRDADGSGGSRIEVEDDLGWGFGFDFNINRNFSLGAGFTWRSANYLATIVDADDPTVTEKIPSVFDMSTFGYFSGPYAGATTLLVRTGRGAATEAEGEIRPDHVVDEAAIEVGAKAMAAVVWDFLERRGAG